MNEPDRPVVQVSRDLQAEVPVAPMEAEHKPRWAVRPLDVERWQRDIRSLGKPLPTLDSATSTMVGLVGGFAVAWIGEVNSSNPDASLVNLFAVATIFSIISAAIFAWRNRNDRDRMTHEAEQICRDIDETVREWKQTGG